MAGGRAGGVGKEGVGGGFDGPGRDDGRDGGDRQRAVRGAIAAMTRALSDLDKAFGEAFSGERDRGRSMAPGTRDDGRSGSLSPAAPAGDGSAQLGGGAEPAAPGKKDVRRGQVAASLLSASKGIRDKLGRSGRRGPGKQLG